MKIVFLTENIFGDTVGGIESHIEYLSKSLVKKGVSVYILIPILGDQNKILDNIVFIDAELGSQIVVRKLIIKSHLKPVFLSLERFHGKGLGLVIALLNKFKFNFYKSKLVKQVELLSPDLVHQHDYIANILASKKLSKKYPVVFTNHTGQYLYLEKYLITRLIQKYLISHFSWIIGPSKELTPNNSKSLYIPNGADSDFFNPLPPDDINNLIQTYKLQGKKIFICPRRWAPTKGVLYFAEALTLLSAYALNNSVFLFAGSNSDDFKVYSTEIEVFLQKIPIESYRLLGNLSHDQLLQYYNIADVVVIPSLMEATSLAAMEGMACCTPVLSTNVGGMPEVVTHGVTGWLVPPANANSIALLIEDIVNNVFNLKSMGRHARSFVVENRSWDFIAEKNIEIYKNVIKIKNG